ncbi:glycoside hydrolase superfamily [Clohesyomyces aquaticus]|uniref:chitinase n=1 Tax=Clohesyomyces aquaticus TaxID=1231657 RepID=A0A1Y1ZHU3_9PLEO|nr:glycoside hydrolase superfamily [Clohesyomyces aquaticus]
MSDKIVRVDEPSTVYITKPSTVYITEPSTVYVSKSSTVYFTGQETPSVPEPSSQALQYRPVPTPVKGLEPNPTYVPDPASDCALQPISTMGGGPGYRAVGYFVNWGIYGRKFNPDMIPADKLTHILYAFGDNRDTGEVFLTDTWADCEKHFDGDSWQDDGKNMYGCLKQMALLKKRNRNMKVLLSIGGWTYAHEAKHFDGPMATALGRKTFADSCVQLIKDYGFDGVDIDWEYPQNLEQGEQLLQLVHEIRKAMDAYAHTLGHRDYQKPHFEISIAAPAGKSNYQNMPLGKIAAVIDFINVMGYDFAGSWDQHTGHQANLYPCKTCPTCTPFNIQSVLHDYTSAGVPPSKFVLGMPLYGRAFIQTAGPGQPFTGGVGEGSFEAGVWDFKDLPKPGHDEHINEEVGASYSFDKATGTMVSYDTVEMACKKAQYIKQHGLGGAMWWELSGDKTGEESIVSNVVRELGGHDGGKMERRPNWLQYPDSCFDNVKNGFPNN